MLLNSRGLHGPELSARPGQKPEFGGTAIPAGGEVYRPAIDVDPSTIRDHTYTLTRRP